MNPPYKLPKLPETYAWTRKLVNNSKMLIYISRCGPVHFDDIVGREICRDYDHERIDYIVNGMLDIVFPEQSWMNDFIQLPD